MAASPQLVAGAYHDSLKSSENSLPEMQVSLSCKSLGKRTLSKIILVTEKAQFLSMTKYLCTNLYAWTFGWSLSTLSVLQSALCQTIKLILYKFHSLNSLLAGCKISQKFKDAAGKHYKQSQLIHAILQCDQSVASSSFLESCWTTNAHQPGIAGNQQAQRDGSFRQDADAGRSCGCPPHLCSNCSSFCSRSACKQHFVGSSGNHSSTPAGNRVPAAGSCFYWAKVTLTCPLKTTAFMSVTRVV